MKRHICCIPRLVAITTTSLVLLSTFCASHVLAAATNKPPATTNAPPKPAPATATNQPAAPIVPLAPPLEVADGLLLSIPKAGLGKDYQFAASIIPQQLAATSTGLSGRIVRFELFPDGVDMYESTRGLVVTEDLPARRLLATFSIVKADDDKVVIDFNKGMRRVFTQSWLEGGSLELFNREYWKQQDALTIAKTGLQKLHAVVRKALA